MEWQPIETAPKDGTSILVAFPFEPERTWVQSVALWDKEFEYIGVNPTGVNYYRGAWTDYTVASWQYERYAELHPTHWMPLPTPPNDQ